jgi:transposase
VHPPTEDEEAIRDLVRAREQVLGDLTRIRHRLSRFLLRRSVLYPNGYPWTQRHAIWLSTLRWEHPADESLFQDARLGVSQLEDRLHALESQIERFSQDERYRDPVGWLRCFRGIDILSAMTLLTELHTVERFSSPRALAAYLGLVPSEYSSGDRIARGGITRKGNRHVRRVLIQIAWQYRFPPQVSLQLQRRRQDQPVWVRTHADRAMTRLHRRYVALTRRGKCRQQVVVAVARELVAFLWATLEEGRQRNTVRPRAA